MAISDFIKREPIATLTLCVTLFLGLLSSPILVNWYRGPNLKAEVHYLKGDDGRCSAGKIISTNSGKSTAKNVRIHYDVDYFCKRGDIECYYSGNEPIIRIEKKVEYENKPGYILIPEFPPGITQHFVYIEKPKDLKSYELRQKLIDNRKPEVFDFPKIELITSEHGQGEIIFKNYQCK